MAIRKLATNTGIIPDDAIVPTIGEIISSGNVQLNFSIKLAKKNKTAASNKSITAIQLSRTLDQ